MLCFPPPKESKCLVHPKCLVGVTAEFRTTHTCTRIHTDSLLHVKPHNSYENIVSRKESILIKSMVYDLEQLNTAIFLSVGVRHNIR